jgi:hypothetical protein
VKIEPTECSETSAFNIQTPGKYPEENIPFVRINYRGSTVVKVCATNLKVAGSIPDVVIGFFL